MNPGALLARMNFALALAGGRLPGVRVESTPLVARRRPAPARGRAGSAARRAPRTGRAGAQTRAVLTAQLGLPEITRLTADDRGPAEHRRRQAGRARARLAGVPAAVSGARCHATRVPEGRRAARSSPRAAPPRFLAARRRRRPRRAARCWSRSSSAAPWTGSAWSCRTATPAYARRAPSIALRPPRARRDATARRPRRLLRPAPGAGAAAAAVGRPGRSPSCTPAARPTPRARTSTRRTTWRRGTPGVKSTPDGWLAARRRRTPPRGAVAVPRGRARARRCRAACAATPARRAAARSSASRCGAEPERGGAQRGFESLYERGRRATCCTGPGARPSRRCKMLKSAGAAAPGAGHGADYPRGRLGDALRQIAQLIKADVGLESPSPTWAAGTPTSAQGAEQGQLANRLARLRRRAGRVRPRPRRPHGRRGRADDVGVRPHGRRERQPRHRPRPRHRDVRAGRRRARRPGLRPLAGPRPPSSSSRAATSPSPPTSAPSSTRSPRATSPSRRRRRSSPAGSPTGSPLGLLG